MAFCTNCGGNVTGAFCNQCGTPATASAGQAPPMQAAPQPAVPPPGAMMPPPGAMMPPAVARKTSPLVWIIVIIAGILLLGFIGVIGTGFFVAHKIHQAGIDTDMFRRNPAAAAARIAAMASNEVDIVSEDDNAGTLTLRDRHTGKNMTMSFDQAKNGRFTFSAQGDDGKTATMEFGAGTVPSWVPSYPGSSPQMTISAKGDGADGVGEGGNFTYTTSDSASRVLAFYQEKAKDLGMKVNLTTTTADAGMMIATDESSHRSLTAIVGADAGKTTVNVTYGAKR